MRLQAPIHCSVEPGGAASQAVRRLLIALTGLPIRDSGSDV